MMAREYMDESSVLCTIPLANGKETQIKFDFTAMFETVASRGEADLAIVSSEQGFSPLGTSSNSFERDLKISYSAEIRRLADWNRSENVQVSLVVFRTKNTQGFLRGLILAPGENCQSYEPYRRQSKHNRYAAFPDRSFYYNISYEAIAFACRELGARRIAISHLSGSGAYHRNMATCHAEALIHFCKEYPEIAPETFTFCGCCISQDHLSGVKTLVQSKPNTTHRAIEVQIITQDSADILHLVWKIAPCK
jgi:hypothetical protein